MRAMDRITEVVTEHSRLVIVVLLAATILVGAGAGQVDQSSSLDQFESDSPEARAQEYVGENFSTGPDNVTSVQIIVRGEGNVLTRESMLRSLRYQRALRENQQVNRTLVDEEPIVGVGNIVAETAIRQERAEELNLSDRLRRFAVRNASLQEDRKALVERRQQVNRTAARLNASLDRLRSLQAEYDALNASYERGEIDEETYRNRSADLESSIEGVVAETARELSLTTNQTATYREATGAVRDLQRQYDGLNRSRAAGEVNESAYQRRAARIETRLDEAYRLGSLGVLQKDLESIRAAAQGLERRGERLRETAEELRRDRDRVFGGPTPLLEDQINQLESMSDEEVRRVVRQVLGEEASSGVFRLMPNDYEPGSTTADARSMVVTQRTDGDGAIDSPETISERISDTQKEMQRVAERRGLTGYLVFGFGIISDEVDRSMADSLAIVGPLALLFVLVTLMIAYRDPLDIVLGVAGIFAVLAWTFGFMGWAGITFNQVMIAIPVLLIGLSIDYAIHIFMRHREHRGEGDAVRGSMRAALAGVGIALVWVTATTVIGFLSNLVSPLGPIQDFGVVSSVGIVAALLIFGALVPAAKVELDEFLEARGFDRNRRAFGTGGGRLSSALSVGATAARRVPIVVIVVALLVSTAGAYGATQVDTSFQQEDFIAEQPPDWMYDLPEPFRPGEYSAKANLRYVNDNFQRADSQAQLLVRGDVATPEAIERFARARDRATESSVTFVLSNGEPAVNDPISTMREVAADNQTFNATYRAADTDGDGLPDENVSAVYDELFRVAPDAAGGVLHRTEDGEYRAARIVVSVRGSATTTEVTDRMRSIADDTEGAGLSVVATGQPVVSEVVQNDLLSTVIESLLITLVAVFGFLALAYRLTENSATLGVVTLLPVALSVSWILGTMYLLGMPFNVLTGMITSLTVGLGVAYSIHISERYRLELRRRGAVHDAMETSVTGTGGALLGSAATTVGGFGVLAAAILPALQQFGIITAMTIVYAFLASVLVLPSLLVVWTRFLGPSEATVERTEAASAEAGSED